MIDRKFPKRALHIDFHTMPGVYDVGRDFDAEEFARTIKEAGVEYVNVFAKCNIGFTYYPSKVGIMHSGLKTDMLGAMVEACHSENMGVTAYFNAGIDHEHALRHREWCKVNQQGQVYKWQEMGNCFRNLCLNTGYGDYILSLVREVLEQYPVDGIFLDCFDLSPCYGTECIDGLSRLGLDPFDPDHVRQFTELSTYKYVDKVKALVSGYGKDLNLYFNGLPYRKEPTHIEVEVLPTGGWGYDSLPFSIRYARTLGKPVVTMTGRFHGGWGDFGGIRSEHSLLFDCYNSIANGCGCSIGDHMHPRGRLDAEVYKLIKKVYSKLSELDPWTDGAEAKTEIVVLQPSLMEARREDPGYLYGVQGVSRMLSELKYQLDVSDGEYDLSKYRVVILPDDVPVSGPLADRLREHISRGGAVLSSAYAGLNPERTRFALDEYCINYEGPEPYNVSFFEAIPAVSRDMPEMLTSIYNPGIAMTPSQGSEVLARLHKPYFSNGEWDWRHENLYIPPEQDSGRPAVLKCGNIIHFSFPVFSSYFEYAVIAYKTLLRNCLEIFLPDPLVKVRNLPSFAQVTLTEKDAARMVHILTYIPELRGKFQVIEEPIVCRDIELALRVDGVEVKNVYLAPSREKLEFRLDGGYAWVTVPEVAGHQLVVFE